MTDNFDRCTYTIRQGMRRGERCVLVANHDGAHAYDQALLGTGSPLAPDSAFTEAEIADAISEEEIRQRTEELNNAQDVWEQAADRAQPKVLCPDCSGRGEVSGGSLGNACPRCHGKRVIDDPGEDPVDIDMPDFATPRAALAAYGDALVWRRHGKQVALPPASTLPSREEIKDLRQRGRAAVKLLTANGPKLPELPASAPARDDADEGGMHNTASDAELDAIEAEVVSETRGR